MPSFSAMMIKTQLIGIKNACLNIPQNAACLFSDGGISGWKRKTNTLSLERQSSEAKNDFTLLLFSRIIQMPVYLFNPFSACLTVSSFVDMCRCLNIQLSVYSPVYLL